MKFVRARVSNLVVAACAAVLAVTVGLTVPPGAGAHLHHEEPAAQAVNPAYLMVSSTGAVYQMGTTNFGDLRGVSLHAPIVGGAATPDGLGYWLVGSDGGVFTFGDAQFYGSTGNVRLNKPIVGMAATPDGKGYWLVASDGGVFTFGDARFYGSTGNVALARPVVGMAPTADGGGYWLVASDGGVFTFGDAAFHGSMGGRALWAPVVGMAASPDGGGYWLVGQDGGVFSFGDAPYLGASGAPSGSPPIVAIMSTAHGYPFPPGGTGYDVSNFQCGDVPSSPASVAVVQVSGGWIDNPPNPCYDQEAAWAGPNVSSYIFMAPVPSPAPSTATTGVDGNCGGNAACEGYNFGYYWAQQWVSYSRGQGVNSHLWWLDVEAAGWPTGTAGQYANAQEVAGAVQGLRAMGVMAGIYSTALQWQQITGGDVSFPGIPLWVPGAGNINDGTSWSAVSFCTNPMSEYAPFAGGDVVLVQYGYTGDGYSGPASSYDLDYACA